MEWDSISTNEEKQMHIQELRMPGSALDCVSLQWCAWRDAKQHLRKLNIEYIYLDRLESDIPWAQVRVRLTYRQRRRTESIESCESVSVQA